MEDKIVLDYLFGLTNDLTNFQKQVETMQVQHTKC